MEGAIEGVENRTAVAPGRPRLAATCCVVMYLYAVYLGAIGVLLPAIGKSFGLGPEAEGRLFPANFAGFTVGVLLCGALSDRFGRKRLLLLGVALYAGGLTLFGRSHTFPTALAAATLIGAGSGAMEAVASALASELYPERRAFIINAIQIAFGAGAASSPIVARTVIGGGLDWRLLYLGLAVANVALFVALIVQRVPSGEAGMRLDVYALRSLIRRPVFGLLCLAEALYVGAETGFFSWAPTYFDRDLVGGARWSGWIVTLFWIAITIGRVATGALVERVSLMRLNLLLSIGAALCAALALAWTAPAVVALFVFLTGLAYSGIFGLLLAEAGERYPQLAGAVYGSVVASGGVGGAIVPWLVGALAGAGIGWRGALLVIPGICLVIAAISAWVHAHPEDIDRI